MQAPELAQPIITQQLRAPQQHQLTRHDIRGGLKRWRIWTLLAWQDIRLRYRRSTLGPLWITLSMAVTIYAMGFLYGVLFNMDLSVYYPFLATGLLAWSLISTLLCESTLIFIDAESFIKQMKQPYSLFIFRAVLRSFIIFAHNILVFIPIVFLFHVHFTWYSLLFFPSLLLIWLNGLAFSTILAILGARYRDLTQLVSSLVQVIFFLTPIMWSPHLLPQQYQFIPNYNPFAQFVDLLRNPLLGQPLTSETLTVTLTITALGLLCAYGLLIKYRSRIVYWL